MRLLLHVFILISVNYYHGRFLPAEATFSLPGETGCPELSELLHSSLSAQGKIVLGCVIFVFSIALSETKRF